MNSNSDKSGPVVGEVVEPTEKKTPMNSLVVGIVAALMVLYLLNPLAGIDLLPDMLPIIGNLDEATATAVLIGCLHHFGIEMPWIKK